MKLLGGGGLQLQRGRLQVHLLQQHKVEVLAQLQTYSWAQELGTRATLYPQHSTKRTIGT